MVSISVGTGSVFHRWQILILRGGIKKTVFFSEKLQKGGESEISLSEKTEIFLHFFLKRGGVPPIPKGCYHKTSSKSWRMR